MLFMYPTIVWKYIDLIPKRLPLEGVEREASVPTRGSHAICISPTSRAISADLKFSDLTCGSCVCEVTHHIRGHVAQPTLLCRCGALPLGLDRVARVSQGAAADGSSS